MANETVIESDSPLAVFAASREVAGKLNPMIGVSCQDTLEICSAVLRELGVMLSDGEDREMKHTFRLTDTIAAALSYEGVRLGADFRPRPGKSGLEAAK